MATKTKNSDGSFRVRFTNYNSRRLELRFKKGQSELAETARTNIGSSSNTNYLVKHSPTH